MLYTRGIRSDVTSFELFQETLSIMNDEDMLDKLEQSYDGLKQDNDRPYVYGWTETYISNFMLNRYANLRVTDQTLYYANTLGYGNETMQQDLVRKLLFLIPSPILNVLNLNIDKSGEILSRGDLISGSSNASFLVTSHVGDGLATFSYWYFPLQFLVYVVVFLLLNSLVFFTNSGVIYSTFGLMSVFTFLGMFRNAHGITMDIAYTLRGFWQGVFTYLIIFYLIKFFLRIRK